MDIITWTPERVERLTQLFEEGLPTAEIGRRLGLTKNAVIGKLHRIARSPGRRGFPFLRRPAASRQTLLRRARGDRLRTAKGAEGGKSQSRLS